MDRLVSGIVTLSQKKHGKARKLLSLLVGAFIFLVVLPWILMGIAGYLVPLLEFEVPAVIEAMVAFVSIPLGLSILAWAVASFWRLGAGTPAQSAPTQHLVVEGPYRHCRNPIELGAITYYLGVGTVLQSLPNGLCCFFLGWVLGTSYHKFVEERELLRRFGDEYERYRQRTPFLIPRLTRRRSREQ